MFLPRVLSLLDEHGVKYRVCEFSPAYAPKDIEQEAFRLGLGLVEGVLLEADERDLILAVVPASLAVNLGEFSSQLAPRKLRLLSSEELGSRLGGAATPHLPPFGSLLEAETYFSPMIEKFWTVGFFVDSARTLITLEAEEFRKLPGNCPARPVPTRARYRANPTPSRAFPQREERCILGVSLENEDFLTPKLIAIADWISHRFAHCLVMIGDGVHRITLQMDEQLPEADALEHSKWLARDFAVSQRSVFASRNSECRFEFVFCSDVQKSEDYRTFYGRLRNLYETDREFQNSFKIFSAEFLRRKPERRIRAQEHAEMSRTYLLEELAVLSCLARDEPWTFVYPGSLTILAEIAEGKHPNVPEGLLNMEYVELSLKSR